MIPLNIIFLFLLFYALVSVGTCIAIFIDSPEYSFAQKLYKCILVWLIPIIGAVLIIMFRRSDRESTMTQEEARNVRDWVDVNDKMNGF